MFLVQLRSWNWIFGGNVATIDVDNFYTLLKVSVSKGHPVFKTLSVEIVYPVHGKGNFNQNYILQTLIEDQSVVKIL